MLLIFQKVLNQIWTYWLRPIWYNWAVCGYDTAAIKPPSNIHSPCRLLCVWLKGAHASWACNETWLLKLGVCVHGLFLPADPGCCMQGAGTHFFPPTPARLKYCPELRWFSGDSKCFSPSCPYSAAFIPPAEGHGNYPAHCPEGMVTNSGRGYRACLES